MCLRDPWGSYTLLGLEEHSAWMFHLDKKLQGERGAVRREERTNLERIYLSRFCSFFASFCATPDGTQGLLLALPSEVAPEAQGTIYMLATKPGSILGWPSARQMPTSVLSLRPPMFLYFIENLVFGDGARKQ